MARSFDLMLEHLRRTGVPALLIAALLSAGTGAQALVAATPARPERAQTEVGARPDVSTRNDLTQQEAPETPAEFALLLAQRLAQRNYDALAELTSPEIRLVTWLGQRRVVDAEEVLQDFAELYLGPAESPYLDSVSDLVGYFGVEADILWGREWPVEQVLFLRGLGDDGATDALLAVIEEDGSLQWGGVLLAVQGFDIASPDEADQTPLSEFDAAPALPTESPTLEATETPAATETPEATATPELTETTDVTVSAAPTPTGAVVRIIRTTNVYPEAVFDVPPSGLIRSGQEAALLESNGDAEYLRIVCPPALEDPCWVVNDPAAVEVLDGQAPEAGAPESPLPTPEPTVDESGAESIIVGEGGLSVTRTGTVDAETPLRYQVPLQVGQFLYINLVSPENAADFSLQGVANGQPYKRIVNQNRSLSFVVPVTQEYEISIEVPEDAGQVEFTLTVVALPSASQVGRSDAEKPTATPTAATAVTVVGPATPTAEAATPEPTSTPTPLPEETATPEPEADDASEEVLPEVDGAVRLRIAAGETEVSETSIVAPQGTDRYVIRALAGQEAFFTVESPQQIADFILVTPDGRWLKGLDGLASWSGTLPESGDYLIEVVNSRRVRVQYTVYANLEPLE